VVSGVLSRRDSHHLNGSISSFDVSPREFDLRGFYFGYYFFAVEHTRLRAAGSMT
jgi:hypothetical protein